MSQHLAFGKYKTTKGIELEVNIYMGWDRPLQQFFMFVEVLDFDIDLTEEDLPEALRPTSDVGEGLIYTNLCDDAEGKDLQYYRNKLTELGIKVPESMFTGSESDSKSTSREANYDTFHEFADSE